MGYLDRSKFFFFFLLQQWLIVLCVYYSMLVSMVTLELKYSPPSFSGLQIFHREISYYFEKFFFLFTWFEYFSVSGFHTHSWFCTLNTVWYAVGIYFRFCLFSILCTSLFIWVGLSSVWRRFLLWYYWKPGLCHWPRILPYPKIHNIWRLELFFFMVSQISCMFLYYIIVLKYLCLFHLIFLLHKWVLIFCLLLYSFYLNKVNNYFFSGLQVGLLRLTVYAIVKSW